MIVNRVSPICPITPTKREMKQPEKKLATPADVQSIELALAAARPWRLEAEVMWSAMRAYEKFHKTAPETYTLEWALDVALSEWDIDQDHPLTKSDEGQMYNMNEQDVNENSAGGGAHADSRGHFSKSWYKKKGN